MHMTHINNDKKKRISKMSQQEQQQPELFTRALEIKWNGKQHNVEYLRK